MLLAKRQHEERESVSSLFFMRQKKKFESELNFAATNSPIQLLPLHAHFGLPWSLHLHYLNFRHIVYVYTSSIHRIFYVLFSLALIPLSPSLPFSRIFFHSIQYIPGIFFQNFFRPTQYISRIFLDFFQNFFLYILYMSWFFLEFFSVSPIKLPKKFSSYIVYMQQFFWNFFPIYVVYMQYIYSSFSFCLTQYYAHHPLGRRAMTIRSEFRELRSLHSSPSWSIRTKVLGFFYIVLYIVYTQYICSIICSILFFI